MVSGLKKHEAATQRKSQCCPLRHVGDFLALIGGPGVRFDIKARRVMSTVEILLLGAMMEDFLSKRRGSGGVYRIYEVFRRYRQGRS
jgi:hypothetical protein